MPASKAAILPCLAVVAFLASATAYAQTGSMAGTIVDASGAAVPGPAITVPNLGIAGVRTARTDARGTYLIPDLAVGNYDVSVEKEGFSTLRFRSVQLTV